jgi:6-phosphogluconolactonase
VTGHELHVYDDAETLAAAVAARLLDLIGSAQADGGVASIALTGGTIADVVHRAVAGISAGSDVDWSRVDVWWGDERFLPAADPERNAGQARRALLDHVPVDPARVHEVPARVVDAEGLGSVAGVEDAAVTYAREIRRDGKGSFDLVMLGIGPDGHVASLFPGHPALDVDDITVAVSDSPKPPPERVSLTFPALNRSDEVWFLASGDGKAEAVARALSGADRHEIPATGVHGQLATRWFLDRAAASRLG